MGGMEEMLADVSGITFNLEKTLDMQLGLQPLPFPGMDKSGAAVCTFFLANSCGKGTNCPYRHIKGDKSIVCKHWLRGLCKKGDECEFLHEYDMQRMPECYFYSRFGECGNKDCPFLHIDPEMKVKACPWYDRGFCRHGNLCKNKHVRRVMCINYLNGFCLDGPSCTYVHPRFELPIADTSTTNPRKPPLTCHNCGEVGHKAIICPRLFNPKGFNPINSTETRSRSELRPLDQVTCFKCGERGHYANKCPSGYHGNFRKPLFQKQQQPYNNQRQQPYNQQQQQPYNNQQQQQPYNNQQQQHNQQNYQQQQNNPPPPQQHNNNNDNSYNDHYNNPLTNDSNN